MFYLSFVRRILALLLATACSLPCLLVPAEPGRSWIYRMRLLLTLLVMIAGCSKTTQPRTSTPPLVLPDSVIELFKKFRQCDQMELVSLDPHPNTQGPELCGWTILGSTAVEDAALRLQLVDAVANAALPPGAIVMDCFEPRHALRIRTEGHHYDVVICFACNAVSVYADGDTTREHTGFCITKAPNDSFNRVLSAAGVKSARGQSPSR